jgi:hypothetical protein
MRAEESSDRRIIIDTRKPDLKTAHQIGGPSFMSGFSEDLSLMIRVTHR